MPASRPSPYAFLPLKTHTLLILVALADGEAHGYAIKKSVEAHSGGAVTLDPGTLYRHIGRLLDEGLIDESESRPDPHLDDARRRYYRLTALGRQVLVAEADRMAGLVAAVRGSRAVKQ